MSSNYRGPERREVERRASVPSLVERAAEIAAQRVAAIHRRRLVTQTFIAALAAAAALCLPVVLIVDAERADTSRQNAQFNCEQGKRYTDVFADFIDSDATLRFKQLHYAERAQVTKAFSKILAPRLIRRLQARSERFDRQTTGYWRHTLLPRLERLARVNCAAVIR